MSSIYVHVGFSSLKPQEKFIAADGKPEVAMNRAAQTGSSPDYRVSLWGHLCGNYIMHLLMLIIIFVGGGNCMLTSFSLEKIRNIFIKLSIAAYCSVYVELECVCCHYDVNWLYTLIYWIITFVIIVWGDDDDDDEYWSWSSHVWGGIYVFVNIDFWHSLVDACAYFIVYS